ncbi:hypothetical protein [Myroides sp. LJL119]
MKFKIFSVLSLMIFISSCTQNRPNNNLSNLEKSSAREVSLSSVVKGDSIYHITKQVIWANDQIISQKTDTIITPAKISDWNQSEPTSLINVPIYVTVQ